MAWTALVYFVLLSPVGALVVCLLCRRPHLLFWLACGVIGGGVAGTGVVVCWLEMVKARPGGLGEEPWVLFFVMLGWPFLLGAAAVLLLGGLIRRHQSNRVRPASEGPSDVSSSTGS